MMNYRKNGTPLTRAELRIARNLLTLLANEDAGRRAAAEPGAYAHIQDQIVRLTQEHPDPPRPAGPLFGAPVRVQCTATGRYIGAGLALVVSAMDNSLFLDGINLSEPPAEGLPLPTDHACEAAHAMLTHLLPGAL